MGSCEAGVGGFASDRALVPVFWEMPEELPSERLCPEAEGEPRDPDSNPGSAVGPAPKSQGTGDQMWPCL